uniref:LytR family transcriptional regulator n=1 Tax=candidate division WWE3 bacterium TaxID=2053526 RepID=A0A832E0N5_UNCKA
MNRYLDLDYIRKPTRRFRRRTLLVVLLAVLLLAGGVFALSRIGFFQSLLAPVSFIVNLGKPASLQEVEGRVNALILGLDTRGGGGLMNTDTILVGSISMVGEDPALISIPRDFWTNLAPYGYARINVAYSYGRTQKDGTFDEEKGIAFAKSKVEEILGIRIPYWVLVDFEGFKEIIDTLGGVEICVERAFDDYSYPVPGRESDPVISRRYEHLRFEAGCQVMDGETALKYARSRSGTGGEGSDFARMRRQQKVIFAVKDKVLSLNLLLDIGKLNKLYRQFSSAVQTNAGLGEIKRGLEIANLLTDLDQIKSLVLDPESGLVYHPDSSLFGGAYVLVPQGGNFDKIHAAVRKLFFGEETTEGGSQP